MKPGGTHAGAVLDEGHFHGAIHYAGGLRWATARNTVTTVLAGWAACCSGRRAEAIRRRGMHSYLPEAVTCKSCKAAIARAAILRAQEIAR